MRSRSLSGGALEQRPGPRSVAFFVALLLEGFVWFALVQFHLGLGWVGFGFVFILFFIVKIF